MSFNVYYFSTGGLVLSLFSAAAITLDTSNLTYIEVYFYDSSTSTEERIKLSLDYLDNENYAQYYSNSNSNWAALNSADTSNKTKYNILFKIANKYIKTQHYLNLIRTFRWLNSTTTENSQNIICCKDSKDCECCKSPDKCCSTCLCCYSSGSYKKEDDCCKCSDGKCELDELSKKSKTFNYHLSNLYSAYQNVYLSPVQAHIKFTDATFSSDFSGSTSGKHMIGTMIYGFIDYNFKPVSFTDVNSFSKLVKSDLELEALSNNNYYANVPHYFSVNLSSGSTTTTTNNLDTIFNELSDSSKIKNKITSTSSSDIECCCCCKAENSNIDCYINKNYVFTDTLVNIQKAVKGENNSSVS